MANRKHSQGTCFECGQPIFRRHRNCQRAEALRAQRQRQSYYQNNNASKEREEQNRKNREEFFRRHREQQNAKREQEKAEAQANPLNHKIKLVIALIVRGATKGEQMAAVAAYGRLTKQDNRVCLI